MKYLVSFLLLALVTSCNKDNEIEKQIATIPIDFMVERFDNALDNAKPSDLPKLKAAYPFMFPEKYSDEFWVARLEDTLQQELVRESSNAFKSFKTETNEIKRLFQHLKYYFPEFHVPRVITTTSSVDYRNKVIVTDTIVLISIDTYLGADHYFYEGIQNYIKKNFEKEQMVVDLAGAYAEKYIYQSQKKTLLDEMIYYGKQLYFKDVMIPFKTDAEKIGYTEAQLEWAKSNEAYIWNYLVDKQLLFSSDSKLPSRFINPAPFSKFNLELIDKESPGRIGQYIGWQIVNAYMVNNDVSLKQMLTLEPLELFNNARFKPRK